MKVTCRSERLSDVAEDVSKFESWVSSEDFSYDVVAGDSYIVFAVGKNEGAFFYYLIGEDQTGYPLPYPSVLFDVVDSTVSKCWSSDAGKCLDELLLSMKNGEVLSFSEWSELGGRYYERLVDEDPEVLRFFGSMREVMISEYNDVEGE